MMTRKVRQAVLEILRLTEAFSYEELAEAATLISEKKQENFLAFLKDLALVPTHPHSSRPEKTNESKPGEARALQELKSADAEKYELLREFDLAIREGRVLKTLDDFRVFGTTLSKEFSTGKSRKEATGRLLSFLAKMEIAAIRTAISKAPVHNDEDERAFRRLANGLISGNSAYLPDAAS